MIYGQDEPMLFPVADLYDSGMMLMYINAARELYNQNREDMKEFRKLYGDFTSPFANDITWVDQLTRGRVNDALNYMQANGIDPLRSAEGRALIQKVINSTDVAGINLRKENAKLGEEYIKNMSEMIKNGQYSDKLEEFFLNELYGIKSYDQFDSTRGMWKRTSPTKFLDIYQATDHIFKDIKPTDLGLDPTGKYRLTGISEDQLNDALDKNLVGFLSTDLGRYYYNTVKDKLKDLSYGIEPSEEDTINALKTLILETNKGRAYSIPEEDQYALDDARTANDIKADSARQRLSHYYREQEADSDLQREIIKELLKGDDKDNIFRKADKNGHGAEEYDVSQALAYNIQTLDSRIERKVILDASGKPTGDMYEMPRSVAINNIYTHNSIYSRNKRKHIQLNDDLDTVQFEATGHLHARRTKENGQYVTRYYISGKIDDMYCEMEVKEGASNYGYKVK